MNTSPRQYPAMHPEKRSRALLLFLVLITVAGMVLLAYTHQPGADTPAYSPDIMEEQHHRAP